MTRPRSRPDSTSSPPATPTAQTTLLVRTDAAVHDPAWTVSPLGLEDIVLAYMTRPADAVRDTRPALEVLR